MKELKAKLNETISEIVKKFEEKQQIWTDDLDAPLDFVWFTYGLICLSLSDIIYDLETEQPKGLIIEWYSYYSKRPIKSNEFINYRSYCMGAR